MTTKKDVDWEVEIPYKKPKATPEPVSTPHEIPKREPVVSYPYKS